MLAGLFAGLACGTLSAWALPCPPQGCEPSRPLLAPLPDEPEELAGAFRLMLGSSLAQTSETVPLEVEQRLQARETRYVHAAFTQRDGRRSQGAMSAPQGLQVLGADLFFSDRDELIETSMLLESDTSAEDAIDELERRWGPADFEIVLPGSLSFVVGWRGPSSYALATFSDLPVFELSIFEDRPEDLLTGTQIVLFEGLRRCSKQLDAGQSPEEVLPELMEIVRWVEDARQVIRPQ
jgi:hypothetical protein